MASISTSQAKYTLDLLLDDMQNGISSTYLYELLDAYAPGSPQGDAGLGLFNSTGAPKPVAIAIHNMNTILADSGSTAASFSASTLPYSVVGGSSTGNNLQLAKSDGSYVIAVWDEQSIWDVTSGSEIAAVPHQETVKLGNGAQLFAVDVYDPLAGTSPIKSLAQINSLTVSVTDHPLFIQVRPSPTPLALTAGESVSGPTNATSITISGSLSGGPSGIQRIKIVDTYNGHQISLGTTLANANGDWSFNTTGLADGTHQFAAAAIDAAGTTLLQVSAGKVVNVDTAAPKPVIKIITGNWDGGITLSGTSEANSVVTVTNTIAGKSAVVGIVTTANTGTWQLTSHVKINTSVVNNYLASAQDAAGNVSAMPGSLILASTGTDTLTSTPSFSDVFAVMSFKGSDFINDFQTASQVGSLHDFIDFSGRGITSFNQVQSMMSGSASTVINIGSGKTVTLNSVTPSSLTAADFRYS